MQTAGELQRSGMGGFSTVHFSPMGYVGYSLGRPPM